MDPECNIDSANKSEKRKKKKRKIENDPGPEKAKKKKFVTFVGGTASIQEVNPVSFHKKYEVAKSDRSKEKAKKYKKKNKKKKRHVVVDNGKILKECTEYLNRWKNDRPNWKFEKLKQIKLVNNMFDQQRVSDEIFPAFVEYISGSSGHMRKLVSTKAMEVVEEMERWCELSEERQQQQILDKPDEMKYNRAREIVQALDD